MKVEYDVENEPKTYKHAKLFHSFVESNKTNMRVELDNDYDAVKFVQCIRAARDRKKYKLLSYKNTKIWREGNVVFVEKINKESEEK